MAAEKNNPDQETPAPAERKEDVPVEKQRDPVKFWTGIILAFCALLFVWHLLSDKYAPYSSAGRIEAFIVPVASQVSGALSEIHVVNNQIVRSGQILAVIDPATYQLAVHSAQAELQQASQTSSADVAAVTTAQAKVAEAEANLRNAEVKGKRIIKLSKLGAASEARADDARTSIEAKQAILASSHSELKRAKSNLGAAGLDNARIKSALAALETTELDLYRTTIRAPSDGVITNLTVDVGQHAQTGSPIMTFIAIKDVWVQVSMRENSLAHIKKGNPVELVLDAAPGEIFKGEVLSVGFGVSDNNSDNLGGLASVQTSQGWLRQAQSFPVLIRFTDDQSIGFRRAGGQVNAIVYTGDHPILNTLGRLWIRLVSFFSHIY
jgi:multidrug resistance efflux pump